MALHISHIGVQDHGFNNDQSGIGCSVDAKAAIIVCLNGGVCAFYLYGYTCPCRVIGCDAPCYSALLGKRGSAQEKNKDT